MPEISKALGHCNYPYCFNGSRLLIISKTYPLLSNFKVIFAQNSLSSDAALTIPTHLFKLRLNVIIFKIMFQILSITNEVSTSPFIVLCISLWGCALDKFNLLLELFVNLSCLQTELCLLSGLRRTIFH